MKRSRSLKLFCLIAIAGMWATFGDALHPSQAQGDRELLAQKAVAILHSRCVQCHGEDKTSGLDLRTREGALKGGSRGVVIKPGAAEESLLTRFIEGEEKPRMPLGDELNAVDVEILKAWIDQGAPWTSAKKFPSLAAAKKPEKEITEEQRNYWAFRTPSRPTPPVFKNAAWVRNPIDRFVLAKLEEKGLKPSPPVDQLTLLRRVTFDLIGLPPTLDEIEAFTADASPDAYEKVVQRLLASPQYGERWAQHWLDVARFGETNGFELDAEREQSWRYRDYVVKAFNDDKPYDRFLMEQIAGDEIDPENFDLRVATGFLRGGPQHVVAGNQDLALNRQEWLTEVMLGIGNGVMGLTVGCARCHDHKFDPIPQLDYYRLQAFFAAADNYDFRRTTKQQDEAYAEALKAHQLKLKPIKEQIAEIEKPYRKQIETEKRGLLEKAYLEAFDKDPKLRNEDEKKRAKEAQRMVEVKWEEVLAALTPGDRETRAALRARMHRFELDAPEPLPRALAVADVMSPTPAMHLLKGGDVHRPGEEVEPGVPAVFSVKLSPGGTELRNMRQPASKSTGRRLELARWLTRPAHPLTARVMMNRLWQHHFGRGIVATPNDFGRNGQQPTHPELLDWLAAEFTRQGWSLKRMHETMVLSNAYRQASVVDPAKAMIDPENKLLWRMNRQRLDAEALRDAVLAVAGDLNPQMNGPSIKAPLEPEVVDQIFTEAEPDNLWPVHPDPRQHARRSLYLIRKRNVRIPMLVAFDSPDLMSSCGARSVSVHALQSLTLLNSDFMLEQSRRFAERLLLETGGRERAALTRLYEIALARKPRATEFQAMQRFLQAQSTILRGRLARNEPVAQFSSLPPGVDRAGAAAWIDLCLATFNLNEFLYLN